MKRKKRKSTFKVKEKEKKKKKYEILPVWMIALRKNNFDGSYVKEKNEMK